MYEKECREVYEILDYMDPEDVKLIPNDICSLIYENADFSYKFSYDEAKSLEEQNLMEKTKAILAYLYVNYFVKDENEKKIFLKKLDLNELEADKLKREKYNPDNLFKENIKSNTNDNNLNSSENTEITKEENSLVKINNSWYKKIWNKIKEIFKI